MARRPEDPDPDIEPPEGYEMSPRFQEWIVRRMREEVFGDEGGMAVVDARMLAKDAGPGAPADPDA